MDMLGAVSLVKKKLCNGKHGAVAGVQKDSPNLFPDLGGPWFASGDTLISLCLQHRDEKLYLGGFSRAFDSLKGNEHVLL